jgi:geranylgeranyl pyrophosphate synthase
VLNAPTNNAWFDHWEKHLLNLGVKIHLNTTVAKVNTDGERITNVEIGQGEQNITENADYYLFAIPHKKLEELLPQELVEKDEMLQKLPQLKSGWQAGLQFYLKEPIKMPRGHFGFSASRWALSGILQTDFWEANVAQTADYGAILSVIIADWDAPGIHVQKPAKTCTLDELKAEIKAQLVEFAPEEFKESFAQMEVLHCEIDPGIGLTGDDKATNETPLYMNTTNSWEHRPSNQTAVDNLFLAGDFTRTSAYLATMESANESGRRAANAILQKLGVSEELCTIHTQKHNKVAKVLQPFIQIDEMLYAANQPHLFDLVEPALVDQLIERLVPLMQFEGSLLQTFDSVFEASLDLLKDFNQKHPDFDVLSLFIEEAGNLHSSQILKEQLATRVQDWAKVNMLMVDKMPLSFPSNLGAYLNTEDPIFAPLMHVSKTKGNMHRVKFAFAINNWLGVNIDQMAHLLETGQCIHNCSLLIDDIMDDTTTRRTQTSAHLEYGVNQTLGAAYTSFFQILLSAYINLGEACLTAYLEESTRAHMGQSHDVYYREAKKCPNEEEYLAMISNKTGSFFRVFIACMLHLTPKVVSTKVKSSLLRLSENIGLLFQVRDDYLDLVSEEYFEKKGTMASDFEEGKFSYPIVHCIQNFPDTYDQFIKVFDEESPSEEQKLELLALLKKNGSFEHTLVKIRALYVEVQQDLYWLESEFAQTNEPIRKWVQKLAENVPYLDLSGVNIAQPTIEKSYQDPFEFDELSLATVKRSLRNVLCAYHVYYKGNGWSMDDFWKCFPLLLTVETMIFNVDNENENSAERDEPVITRAKVEKSKMWQIIRNSGFYTDEMDQIYDDALVYYQQEFDWYKGNIGDDDTLTNLNHLKSTNFRIMHILSKNILEKPANQNDYLALEDYVSLAIEFNEQQADAITEVYNVYEHFKKLHPQAGKEVFVAYQDQLKQKLSSEQLQIASEWLAVYQKGSALAIEEDSKVAASFRKIYITGRAITELCLGDADLAAFTLQGNFKWCVGKFKQEQKNIISSDAVFRKLQNNVLSKLSEG